MLFLQAVIDANIISPLVHLLQHAEFDIKKEAAWAISNATSGGSSEQIQYVTMFLYVYQIFCSLIIIIIMLKCRWLHKNLVYFEVIHKIGKRCISVLVKLMFLKYHYLAF